MPYDLHIVRTDDWLDAKNSPITREDIDKVIRSDPELEWSSVDYVDMKEGADIVRFFLIKWNGYPCFWWYRDQITCASPDEQRIAKLVEMAEKLKANVIGDDGEKYVIRPGPPGTRAVEIIQV